MINRVPAVVNVVVPSPSEAKKYEFNVVDEAMREDTVKLFDVVAMSVSPSDDDVMIELAAND
jgi:hypothetical protein